MIKNFNIQQTLQQQMYVSGFYAESSPLNTTPVFSIKYGKPEKPQRIH